MNLIHFLRILSVKLELNKNSIFDYPVEKQKRYVALLGEPNDDFQRSYFQYKCQMELNGFLISTLLNITSLPLLILFLLKTGEKSKGNERLKKTVFFADGKPDTIIPDILRERVGEIEIISEKKCNLSLSDKKFVINIWKRHPFSFHFIAKCLIKIQNYSFEIQRLRPQNIVVCNEYSFTSSILTKYCEEKGIKHINVMHGEKLYYMRDSFFHFHECYVWDNLYKDLFLQLRAEPTQFKIAIPPSLKFPNKEDVLKTINYTYYMGTERGQKLQTVVRALERMRLSGLKIAIRPHPRYSDLTEIAQLAPRMEIEDLKKLTIEQSLKRTQHAISVYSTVLNQAFNNGINIVLDDISDKAKFNSLKERFYVMLNKPHSLLSEIAGNDI